MFPISAVNAASRRALARQVLTQGQKRGMALGGAKGPPPKWEGLDKVVRTYLPEDHQVCMAVLGGYATLIVLYKISSSFGKKKVVEEAAPTPVVAAVTTSSEVPDIESPGFEQFLDSEAFVKLLDNEEHLKSVLG